MNVEIDEPEFRPVTIRLETIKEVETLWHCLNSEFNGSYTDRHEVNMGLKSDLWNALNSSLVEHGYKSPFSW